MDYSDEVLEATPERVTKLLTLGPTTPLPEPADAPAEQRRREALVELRGWFEEWSSTARAVVKKRGYLIRLGLASRKPPQRKSTGPAAPGGATVTK